MPHLYEGEWPGRDSRPYGCRLRVVEGGGGQRLCAGAGDAVSLPGGRPRRQQLRQDVLRQLVQHAQRLAHSQDRK